MDTLKKHFKDRLTCFKGRTLDQKTIVLLSQCMENEFINFMGNEGFVLENSTSGTTITTQGIEKLFQVNFLQDLPKEYETFSNACKYSFGKSND